jgi:hypothetical protein
VQIQGLGKDGLTNAELGAQLTFMKSFAAAKKSQCTGMLVKANLVLATTQSTLRHERKGK